MLSLEKARQWQSDTLQPEKALAPILSVPAEKASGPKFLDIVEEWKRRRFSAMEESTQVRYQNIIDLYLGSLLQLPLYELTPQRIDLWLDQLKDPKSWTMKSKK